MKKQVIYYYSKEQMNSFTFFKKHREVWNDKSGIYVIECEALSKEYGTRIFKVGMATHSLTNRMSNYRTSYSIIPFTIHALYHIPTKVYYRRANYHYLSEKVLHKTLTSKDLHVFGEWFTDLRMIMNCVNQMRENHLKEIPESNNWLFKTYSFTRTKFSTIKLADEDTAFKSKVKKVENRENLERTRTVKNAAQLVGEKGVIDLNNEAVEGKITLYSSKTKMFEIELDTKQTIDLSWDKIFDFLGLRQVEKTIVDIVKEKKQKDKIVLRTGREIIKR